MDALSRSARCEDVVIPQMEPGAEYVSGSGQASQGRYAVLLSRFNSAGETNSASNTPHRITVNSASSVCHCVKLFICVSCWIVVYLFISGVRRIIATMAISVNLMAIKRHL